MPGSSIHIMFPSHEIIAKHFYAGWEDIGTSYVSRPVKDDQPILLYLTPWIGVTILDITNVSRVQCCFVRYCSTDWLNQGETDPLSASKLPSGRLIASSLTSQRRPDPDCCSLGSMSVPMLRKLDPDLDCTAVYLERNGMSMLEFSRQVLPLPQFQVIRNTVTQVV